MLVFYIGLAIVGGVMFMAPNVPADAGVGAVVLCVGLVGAVVNLKIAARR